MFIKFVNKKWYVDKKVFNVCNKFDLKNLFTEATGLSTANYHRAKRSAILCSGFKLMEVTNDDYVLQTNIMLMVPKNS